MPGSHPLKSQLQGSGIPRPSGPPHSLTFWGAVRQPEASRKTERPGRLSGPESLLLCEHHPLWGAGEGVATDESPVVCVCACGRKDII